jgi:hypothetical protein
MNRRGRRPLLCTRETRPQGIHQVRGRLRSAMLGGGNLLAGGLALDEVAVRVLVAIVELLRSKCPAMVSMMCAAGQGDRMPTSAPVNSGILGATISAGSAGGRTSAAVNSGAKAAGGRMPTSAPVSVSCFGI